MINITNFTSEDKSSWEPARPAQPTGPPGATATSHTTVAERAGARSLGTRIGDHLVILGGVLLSWPAAIARRLGDRLFAMNDTEAYWRDWQITKVHGGLRRRYRDPRFDTLAECAKCHGAGVTVDLPCAPCLGTGRITLGEVS